MNDLDPFPQKTELLRRVEDMEDWQARLVLSFVNTLFGSEPIERRALEGER